MLAPLLVCVCPLSLTESSCFDAIPLCCHHSPPLTTIHHHFLPLAPILLLSPLFSGHSTHLATVLQLSHSSHGQPTPLVAIPLLLWPSHTSCGCPTPLVAIPHLLQSSCSSCSHPVPLVVILLLSWPSHSSLPLAAIPLLSWLSHSSCSCPTHLAAISLISPPFCSCHTAQPKSHKLFYC